MVSVLVVIPAPATDLGHFVTQVNDQSLDSDPHESNDTSSKLYTPNV